MKKLILLTILIAAVLCVNGQAGELMIKKGDKGLYLDHKVAPKEGLYAIGRLYNVNPKFIALFNNIDLYSGLAIGQTIHIPLTDTNFTQKGKAGVPVYYAVGENENLSKVSNLHNKVALQKLKDWNGLKTENPRAGAKLVVGFLASNEMAARSNNAVIKDQPVKQQEKPVAKTEPEKEKSVKIIPADDKPELKAEKKEETPIARNETLKETQQPPKEISNKSSEPVSAVIKETGVAPGNPDPGYFKASFDQQVKASPARKNATVTAGIFKTSSGWQDAKYYLLIDNVPTGTIIKITNPDNNKAVYAKVLGEMNGIRQNEGLDIRLSNAAAATLGVTETDKFIVKINY